MISSNVAAVPWDGRGGARGRDAARRRVFSHGSVPPGVYAAEAEARQEWRYERANSHGYSADGSGSVTMSRGSGAPPAELEPMWRGRGQGQGQGYVPRPSAAPPSGAVFDFPGARRHPQRHARQPSTQSHASWLSLYRQANENLEYLPHSGRPRREESSCSSGSSAEYSSSTYTDHSDGTSERSEDASGGARRGVPPRPGNHGAPRRVRFAARTHQRSNSRFDDLMDRVQSVMDTPRESLVVSCRPEEWTRTRLLIPFDAPRRPSLRAQCINQTRQTRRWKKRTIPCSTAPIVERSR